MSDEQKGFWGCIALIGIALLIGVGLRSKSLVQFLVMGAGVVFGILSAVWCLGGLSGEGCSSKLVGLWWGAMGVSLAITVGTFLVTGDYDHSLQLWNRLWGQVTPTPEASVQSDGTPEATLMPTETVQATATPTLAPTPQPTFTPTPAAAPPTTAATSPAETPWYLADRSIAKPMSKQLESWRLYLGIILGIQYLMALYVAQRTKRRNIGYNLILGIVGMLLVFTKLGEWMYKIILWVFGWGTLGRIVAVILGLLTGVGGVGNITAYIIAGYVYYDLQVMGLCVLPSVIVAFPALFIALRQARGKRYLE
jgi:hypothetical protein